MRSSHSVSGSLRRRILTATTVVLLAMTTATTAEAAQPAHPSHHKVTQHKVIHPKAKAKHPVKHKVKHKKAAPKKQTVPAKAPAPAGGTPTTTEPKGSAVTAPVAAGTTAAPTAVPESPVGGPFGASSFWRQSLVGAPVGAGSSAMVATLAGQVQAVYGGIAAFNVWQFNDSFVTVTAAQPKADVHWDNCQGKPGVPTGLLGPGGQFTAVPIPDGAVPASGSDAELTVYSPSSDQLWEFWHARHAADGWHACWGGRIDHVSTSLGYFTGGFGATATAIATGEPVSLNDIRTGVINHAVPIAIPSPAASVSSWPAQRTDGADLTASAMPEGTRLRLPASIDLTTLGLSPIALMIAKAAQTYGMVVLDRAGAVAVIAESGNGDVALTGHNPWDTLLGGTPAYNVLRNFPWDKLQAMPLDWGKPANAPS